MKTKILIGLIILVCLGAGGFFVYKSLPWFEIEKPVEKPVIYNETEQQNKIPLLL